MKLLGQWQDELLGRCGAAPAGTKAGQCGPRSGRRRARRCLPGTAAGWRCARSDSWAGDLCAGAPPPNADASATNQAAAHRTTEDPSGGLPGRRRPPSPQLWLTLLWHVGSGLPWAWRTGPSGASERDQLVALAPELPAQALLAAAMRALSATTCGRRSSPLATTS